jgi:hypothetical protein
MNKRIKPFRLLSKCELLELEHYFINKLVAWNKQNALRPLSCHLETNLRLKPDHNEWSFFTSKEQPIALVDKTKLDVLKQCVFGNSSPCFDSANQTIMRQLLSQLVGIDVGWALAQQVDSNNNGVGPRPNLHEEWFYHGAPTVALNLMVDKEALVFYIHPQWVIKFFPKPLQEQKRKSDLQRAVETEIVHCQVELQACSLKIQDTMSLQVGDVIKTNHPLFTSALFKHKHDVISQVLLGKTQQYKSIQIESPL